MTACRAGWHNSVTPDKAATISRWFLFCFKCLWPLPQQRVSKRSFCNLLWFHSPHFYHNPESEGVNKSEGFTVLQSMCLGHSASQWVEGPRQPAPGPYKHEAVLKADLEKGAAQKYQMIVASALPVLLRKMYLICLGASYITESWLQS